MSYFAKLGIIGWEGIEPIILGAMLSNKSVLLLGPHGANKTEGAASISKAVYGEGSKFVPYDTSLVNADDLLGFLHPEKLRQGEIDYISTPDSIWDAQSCLLDEINRCNPYNAAKFFEIVRCRTINGRPTALEFVWAACNPPDRYNTAHMDAAQVSRFMVLSVPSFAGMNQQSRKAVLLTEATSFDLKPLMDKARNATVAKVQEKKIQEQTQKTAKLLAGTLGIEFSGRQVRDLYNMLMNMDRIASTMDGIPEVDEEVLTDMVMGLVPETTGLIRATVDKNAVRGEIATLMKGFKLSDPILTASNVIELCKADLKGARDMQGWAGAVTDMLMVESDEKLLNPAWQEITKRQDLSSDVFNALRQAFAARDAMFKVGKEATVDEMEKAVEASLKTFGPRKKARKSKKK